MKRRIKKGCIFLGLTLPVLYLALLGILQIRKWAGETYDLEYARRYEHQRAPQISSIQLRGENDAYALIQVEKGFDIPDKITVSRNYAVSVDYVKRVDKNANEDKIDEGESVTAMLYDLRTRDLKPQKLELLPLLEKQGITDWLNHLWVVTYQEEDYLVLHLVTDNDTYEKLYHIETGKLSDVPKDVPDFKWGAGKIDVFSRIDVTSLIQGKYNVFLNPLALNPSFHKVKNLSEVNLSEEDSALADALSSGSGLFLRSGLVSDEAWFNQIIHWFAPKGQEVMELYASQYRSGVTEKTQIRSYADYLAWEAAHPEEKGD